MQMEQATMTTTKNSVVGIWSALRGVELVVVSSDEHAREMCGLRGKGGLGRG